MSEQTTATPDQSVIDYVKEHRAAVLATTNKSGTPQQTLIGYRMRGDEIVISTRRATLKAKNLSVRPHASLAIIDGRNQVIVHGRVKTIRDAATVLAIHKEAGLLADRQTSDQEFAKILLDEDRVILQVKPERYYPTAIRQR